MFMRLSQTMKTDSFLNFIRQTPMRHWDSASEDSIRCNTSSCLFLQLGDGVTLLPSGVNSRGYYDIPYNMPISEACVRLPQTEEPAPTYDFLLELCRILAQSREGYFDSDHRCAKQLPMMMLVLESEEQAERFKVAVSEG
jgi:hypothetical protein